MDIEPAGMSPIDMDILCWSCNRKHEIEPYKTLGSIWILPSSMTGQITNIMLIHAHLWVHHVGTVLVPKDVAQCGNGGCQCVNASLHDFIFSFSHSLDPARPHFLIYQSWKAWI
jgi:hypothetical protein